MDMFSESSCVDAQKTFPPKYLNIVDPLKEYNNLGRSVHRENRDPQFGISSCIANEDKHGIINGKPSAILISSSNTDILENFPLDIWLKDWSGMECYVEPLDPPSDLTGDYDSHLRNLLYGQIYHGVALSSQVVNDPHLPSSSLQYLYQQHNSNIRDVESYNDFAIGSASASICLSKEYECTMEDTCTYFPETNFWKDGHLQSRNVRNKKREGISYLEIHIRKLQLRFCLKGVLWATIRIMILNPRSIESLSWSKYSNIQI